MKLIDDLPGIAPGGRGSIPLHSIHRYANGVLQGSAHDQIWSVCSGQSGRAGAINSGGVPAKSAADALFTTTKSAESAKAMTSHGLACFYATRGIHLSQANA